MKLQEIEIGILDYVNNEIAPKANGLTKFLIYSGTALGTVKLENLIGKYKPLMLQLGIMNTDGDIDIEALYQAAKTGIQNSGSFTAMGIIFDESDIDNLYKYIKEGGSK